jgi:hypothetical protein
MARPAPPPAVEHAAVGHPGTGRWGLDPGAPGGTFTHWLVYGIPPGISNTAAG